MASSDFIKMERQMRDHEADMRQGQEQIVGGATYRGGHPTLTKRTQGGIRVNQGGLLFYKGKNDLLNLPYSEIDAVRLETWGSFNRE